MLFWLLKFLYHIIFQISLGHISALLFDKNHRPDIDLGTDTNLTDIGMSVRATSNDNRLALQIWRKTKNRILIDASYGSVYVTQKYSEIRYKQIFSSHLSKTFRLTNEK
jgi:hypothetical protein